MDYTVYTYGGGEVLWKTFNGIVLIFGNDSSYFTSVGKITISISLLYMAIRALPRASFPFLFKSWMAPTLLLTTLFFGTKSSVFIIDEVDPDFKISKVDHVPVGIAAVASLSSQIGKYFAEVVEEKFGLKDAEKSTKVGSMFGARLVSEATKLTIKDPILRENIKDFVRQCFYWPYVAGNINPGKKAALETKDILGFIKENPHPLLGVYWRENGASSFQKCSDCVSKVNEALKVETESGLKALSLKAFSGNTEGEEKSKRLKQYFGDAWASIAKGSGDSAETIQQNLMINAYRESLLDLKDSLQMTRIDTDLLRLNAAREREYQNQSFLVKAALAGTQIVNLHTLLFALSLIFFTVVAPLTFLPQGIKLLMTWLKVMIWLSTWPILMAVLNALGAMYASRSVAASLMSTGEGLTILTQNGLSEAAFEAYCWVSGLQFSIPMISWAFVSGGGYGLSQLAGSFTQTGESFSAKVGSELVDGNVSFNTQSLHTRQIANSQIAQQQLGASFNTGMRFDDGKMVSLIGSRGETTLQEHLTNLGTNVSSNDAMTAMAGIQSQMALQASHTYSRMKGEQVQQGINELFSVAKSFAESKGTSDTYGSHEMSNAQKSMSQAMDTVKSYARNHGISEEKAFTLLLGASASANINSGGSSDSGILSKLKGVLGVGFRANGQMTSSGRNAESLSQDERSGESKQFVDNFGTALQYLEDHKGQSGNTFQRQQLDQAQEHFNRAINYSDQEARSLNDSQQWSQTASVSHQKSLSQSQNINDEILGYIAQQRFGGDKQAAAQWQSAHKDSYYQMAEQYLESRGKNIKSLAQQGGLSSKDAIKQNYEESKSSLIPPTKEEFNLRREQNQSQVHKTEESLSKEIEGKRLKSKEEVALQKMRIEAGKQVAHHKENRLDEDFKKSNEEYLITKAGRKMWNG